MSADALNKRMKSERCYDKFTGNPFGAIKDHEHMAKAASPQKRNSTCCVAVKHRGEIANFRLTTKRPTNSRRLAIIVDLISHKAYYMNNKRGDNMKKGLHQSVTMSVRQNLSQKLIMTPHIRRKISEEELKEKVILPKKTR